MIIDFFLTVGVLVLLFGFLVFIHELGHFLAAKMIGVEVEEFAFGFGNKLFARKYGDTLYRINLIPLGGYVKVLGDEDPASFTQVKEKGYSKENHEKFESLMEKHNLHEGSLISRLERIKTSQKLSEDERVELVRYVNKYLIPNDSNFILNKGFWGRLWVYSAGVIMNLIVAVGIFSVFLMLNNYTVRLFYIAEYPFIGGQTEVVKKPLVSNVYDQQLIQNNFDINEQNQGIVLLSIAGEEIKDAEHFENLWNQIEGKEVEVVYQRIVDGKEFTKSLVLNDEGFDINIEPSLLGTVVFGEIYEGNPASVAGIEPRDTLIGINREEVRFDDPNEFLSLLESNSGKNVEFEILNENGEREVLSVELNSQDGEEFILGASFQLNYIPLVRQYKIDYSEFALLGGLSHTINVFGYNPVALAEIFSISVKEKDVGIAGQSVTSIWGVGEHINSLVVARDYNSIINVAGLVSVSLAFMNILPIPLLDGGQILFLIIEKLRGKPLGPVIQERIARISFFLLILLSVVIILKDIWLGFIGDSIRSIF